MNYQPPYTITPSIVNLVAEIGEIIGRYTVLAEQSLAPRLRRDEMWVAERDATGASNLLSFSEYKDVRYDKDIRKSYLQGRLGGIPRILLGGALTNPCLTEESEGDD